MGIMFDPPRKPLSKHFIMDEMSSTTSFFVAMAFDPDYSPEEGEQHLQAIRSERCWSTGAAKDRDRIQGRYLCVANITGLPGSDSLDKLYPNFVDRVSSYREDSDPAYSTYLKGNSTPENQRWCIT